VFEKVENEYMKVLKEKDEVIEHLEAEIQVLTTSMACMQQEIS
jgi:hypothetical protein